MFYLIRAVHKFHSTSFIKGLMFFTRFCVLSVQDSARDTGPRHMLSRPELYSWVTLYANKMSNACVEIWNIKTAELYQLFKNRHNVPEHVHHGRWISVVMYDPVVMIFVKVEFFLMFSCAYRSSHCLCLFIATVEPNPIIDSVLSFQSCYHWRSPYPFMTALHYLHVSPNYTSYHVVEYCVNSQSYPILLQLNPEVQHNKYRTSLLDTVLEHSHPATILIPLAPQHGACEAYNLKESGRQGVVLQIITMRLGVCDWSWPVDGPQFRS